MRLPLWVEGIIAACLVFGLAATGWIARGWKEDSQDLHAAKAIDKAVAAFRTHEENIANSLEKALSKLRANQRVVEKHRETVIERPVYRNICLDDDGLRLIEAARTGQAPASQPAAQVPAVPQ
jgi:hypothetical protein